jgi:hypothetical protein
MKEIVTKHINACMAELRTEVERMFGEALKAFAPSAPPAQERGSPPRRGREAPPESRARTAKPAKPGSHRAVKAVKAGARTCGCGPVGRHRRDCKLKAAKPARKAAADDEERGADVPADLDRRGVGRDLAAVQRARDPRVPARAPDPARAGSEEADLVIAERQVRASRAVEPAPELPAIPHAALVARLAADRERTGDAGGIALRPVGPSLVGHVDSLDRRETCPVHGWVGRRQFVEGGHAQCAQLPEGAEPCRGCKGRGFAQSLPCKRCDGTRVDPGDRGHRDIKPENPIQDNAPHDAAEGA